MSEASKDWPHKVFVEHAALFVRFLEQGLQRADEEVDGLTKIFSEFGVPKRGRILDLACGIGRHAIPLARKGYSVVGVDLSPLCVRRARTYAKKKKVTKTTKFYVADARQAREILADEQPFDAILNLFTSHGYYGEEEDLKMFGALKALASPDCLLVVDTANRDWLVIHFEESGIVDLGDIELHERRRLNLETSHMENLWSFYKRRNGDLKLQAHVEISHRVYCLHELKALLEKAGWRYVKCYGDFKLEAFTLRSNRMIVCCNPLHA